VSAIPATIGRARLQRTATGLRVVIPALLSWLVLVYYPFLCWIVFANRHELGMDESWFLKVCWVAVAVAFPVRRLFWSFLGREIITVDAHTLTVRYEIAGIGWQRPFQLNRISNMDYAPRFSSPVILKVIENRCVAFDYSLGWNDGVRYRFGLYFSPMEVQQFISVLESYTSLPLRSPNKVEPLPAARMRCGCGAVRPSDS